MRNIPITLLASLTILCSCKSSGEKTSVSEKKLTVKLEAKSGSKVEGTAEFTEKNGVVIFTAKFTGLEPGVHAIHIHENADCSAGDATSAGGHWNPTFKKHGKWGDSNHHKGDIGNFPAEIDGTGMITLSTDEWCIGCGDKTKDILGKGLIVHAKADDYTTQPTGDAGGRVACGGLIK